MPVKNSSCVSSFLLPGGPAAAVEPELTRTHWQRKPASHGDHDSRRLVHFKLVSTLAEHASQSSLVSASRLESASHGAPASPLRRPGRARAGRRRPNRSVTASQTRRLSCHSKMLTVTVTVRRLAVNWKYKLLSKPDS